MTRFRITRSVRGAVFAATIAFAISPAASATVLIEPLSKSDEKIALEMLVRSVAEHTDLYRDYRSLSAAQGNEIPAKDTKQYVSKSRSATFATAEYDVLDNNGNRKTYTYYAKSGTDVDDMVSRLKGSPSGHGPTRSGVKIARIDFDDFHSSIGASEALRFSDAELKIGRTIERDIRLGKVRPDGTLRLWVSQEPCSSCRAALDELNARVLTKDVHVRYVGANTGKDVTAPSARFHARRVGLLNGLADTSIPGPRTASPRTLNGCL